MSGLTMCPACQAAVPSGQFCAICGSPLRCETSPEPVVALGASPSALQPAQTLMPQAAELVNESVDQQPTQRFSQPYGQPHVLPTQVQSPGRSVGLAGEGTLQHVRAGRRQAVIAGVLAVVAASAFVVFGMGGKHTVTGEVTLTADAGGMSAGDSCEGQNGYDDISGGGEVRIKDESGTLVATGRLESGTFDGVSCVFPFTVKDVPRAKYYEISAGNDSRGGVHFSADELKSQHWAAHLTLGS